MRVRRGRPAPPASVRTLMKAGVPAAGPGEPLAAAAASMRSRGVGALVVMDDDRLVGILTERDLLRAMADGLDPRATPVSACMTARPQTVSVEDTSEGAARRMVDLGVRHLPVVEDGRVVGVISARDLLRDRRGEPEWLYYEPW